jgi:hypothetical protein
VTEADQCPGEAETGSPETAAHMGRKFPTKHEDFHRRNASSLSIG